MRWHPMSPSDLEAVTALLGRVPMGRFEVRVRSRDGGPVVIENSPVLDDGTPMPTRFWLVGSSERVAVSRLESAGGVKQAEAAVDGDALEAAHERYRLERDANLVLGPRPAPSGGVGGTRVGVKCLHAHLAWWLTGADDPVGEWTASRTGIDRTQYQVVDP